MSRCGPRSSWHRSLCAAAVAVLVGSPSRAAADHPVIAGAAPDRDVVFDSVDWTALALGEFAVGGPATNLYAPRAKQTETADHCLVAKESASPACAGHSRADCAAATAPSSIEEAHASRQVPPTTFRASVAAAEILKLRRAVGFNPIAGTMFDAPPGRHVSCSGGKSDLDDAALLSEQAIAEAIRRFEAEQSASDDALEPFQGWRGSDDTSDTELALLRPAEQKLEEAAELLERLGEYERADVARDLAFQMRQQARQLERRQRQSIVSEFITGGGVIDR